MDSAAAFRAALFAATGTGSAKSAGASAPVAGSASSASLPVTLLQSDNSGADGRIADFRAWKSEYFTHGISEDHRQAVEDNSATYEAVLTKAASSNGFDNPKAFLKSLSPSELTAVQTIHCLANPIDVDSLSEEGAANLLVSPDQAQDIDNDGFEMVGAAKTRMFPPPNAPASVKQAWKDATAHMSDSDMMLLSGSFLATDQSAYIAPDADYADLVQRTIDGAKLSAKYDQSWQHETRGRQLSLLQSFLNKLQTG